MEQTIRELAQVLLTTQSNAEYEIIALGHGVDFARKLIEALDVLEKIVNHSLLTGNPFREAGMTDELIMMMRKSDAYDELQIMARKFLEGGDQ